MQTRPHPRQCQTRRVDPDVYGQPNRVREPGQQHGRRDARRVGNRVGVVGMAVADRDIFKDAARNVPRRNNKREAKRRLAVLVGQRVDQRQFDADAFTGEDVAHPHGEDVRPLLLRDRGPAARGDRLVVLDAGGFALAQLRLDDPSAGGHAHPGDRGPIR